MYSVVSHCSTVYAGGSASYSLHDALSSQPGPGPHPAPGAPGATLHTQTETNTQPSASQHISPNTHLLAHQRYRLLVIRAGGCIP